MFPVAGIEVVLSAKNPGGAASTGSISGSVLLTLRVPAVFRGSVLLWLLLVLEIFRCSMHLILLYSQ